MPDPAASIGEAQAGSFFTGVGMIVPAALEPVNPENLAGEFLTFSRGMRRLQP